MYIPNWDHHLEVALTTVLLVEDDSDARSRIVAAFKSDWPDSLVIHEAATVEVASELFQTHQAQLDLVLMDACVPGNSPNTQKLVGAIREAGFAGPMICISSLPRYGEELIAAGCSSYHSKRDPVSLVIAAYDAVTAVPA